MIHRSTDVAFFNEVANHPSVRPFLGGPEGGADVSPLDLAPMIQNPAVITLQAAHGGWIFSPILPGAYEVHTLFLPEGRGRKHLAAAQQGFRYMFAETDCLEILTKCPDDNGPARWASSYLGFRERFHRTGAWTPEVGISFRAFSIDDWFVRDPQCLREGRALHEVMEAAKVGSGLPDHPEDEAHDRAAGAAALMIRAGQTNKGVGFYNRWATFAGYPPIQALSATVVDVGAGVIMGLRADGSLTAMVLGIS